MKLQDQVITEQQAIRLKELSVKQESLWSWYITTDRDDTSAPYIKEVAAFTADELAAMLPKSILMDGYNMLPSLVKFNDKWSCTYGAFSENQIPHLKSNSIAGAVALILIHLFENKLITAEEVNARL